jgi:hypothetical protein
MQSRYLYVSSDPRQRRNLPVALAVLALGCGQATDADGGADASLDGLDAEASDASDAMDGHWTECGYLPNTTVGVGPQWDCCSGVLCRGNCDPQIGCYCGTIAGCPPGSVCCAQVCRAEVYCQ